MKHTEMHHDRPIRSFAPKKKLDLVQKPGASGVLLRGGSRLVPCQFPMPIELNSCFPTRLEVRRARQVPWFLAEYKRATRGLEMLLGGPEVGFAV